ncbi:MAG: hypothetical protein ACPKQO_01090 [Nitrososphaeraceae archaeon]
MSINLCPRCGRGQLQPTKTLDIVGEDDTPLRKHRHTREYVCNICGYKHINTDINPNVK